MKKQFILMGRVRTTVQQEATSTTLIAVKARRSLYENLGVQMERIKLHPDDAILEPGPIGETIEA